MIMRRYTSLRWAALVAAAGVALAGCAGGADSGGSSGAPASSADSGPSGVGSREAGSEADSAAPESAGGADQDLTSEHIAREAGLDITVKDLDKSVERVRSVAEDADGRISSEQTRIDPDRQWSSTRIEVTVPAEELDATLAELEDLGEVTERTSETTDLSSTYTDTDARVRTMKKSISRLEKLLDGAEDLGQVIKIEDELTDREADLESLTRRLKALEKRTTTAPITLDLSTESAPVNDEEETGFVAGLQHGWSAFTSSVAVLVTVLGAVLPFAVVAALVLGPLWWWIRRRRSGVSEP